MKKCVIVSIAGFALAGSAMAQNDVGVSAAKPQLMSEAHMGGATQVGVSSRTNQLVYDNSYANYLTNGAFPRGVCDDVRLDPTLTAGATFPLNINGCEFAFAEAVATDFDAEVLFYDNFDTAAPAGTTCVTGLLGGFILQVRGNPVGSYTTGLIDLSVIGGVNFNDAGVAVTIKFYQPDTTTYVAAGAVHAFYAASLDTATWATSRVGDSWAGSIRDANSDGIFDIITNDGFRNFAFPNAANLYLTLQADVPALGGGGCPADFDGDGTVDFFDYDAFVVAFETPC